MRSQLSSAVVTVCLLTLASRAVQGQTTAEARKLYDAAVQDAKRSFLKCDPEGMSDVAADYTGVNFEGNVTKGRAAELKSNRDFCAANTFTVFDLTTTDFHSSGPVVWAAGTLTAAYKPKATGKEEKKSLHFLTTFAIQNKKLVQQYFMTAPMAPEKK
jgi:hypothetical protein